MPDLPGPRSRAMIEELGRYVVANPWPFVLDLEHSQGMWMATIDGERLFDWAGFYGARLLGHNHPRLGEPDYVRRLARAANNKLANPDFLTPECLEYYRTLYGLAPVCMRNDRLEVYVINSGAEAVENMLKYLINLHLHKRRAEGKAVVRRRFVYFDQAFHGRTVFALSVTQMSHAPVVTRGFHGFDEGNIQVPFPHVNMAAGRAHNLQRTECALARVERIVAGDPEGIVGIIVEPLQGAGGHRVALPELYRGLSDIAHRYGVYLGIDEVQTAGGQTGTFFAIDQYDLPHPPQAVAAAKKLGCGVVYMLYPMEDRDVLDSTWGGSLADMVRFVEEMRIVRDERLIEQVPEKARRLTSGLRAIAERHRAVYNVRGLGLYQGFSLRTPALRSRLREIALRREGMLLLGAGENAIRLRPPLDVSAEEIDLFARKLDSALSAL